MKRIFSYHVGLIHLPVRGSINCSIPLLNQHDILRHSMTADLQVDQRTNIELTEPKSPVTQTDIILEPAEFSLTICRQIILKPLQK